MSSKDKKSPNQRISILIHTLTAAIPAYGNQEEVDRISGVLQDPNAVITLGKTLIPVRSVVYVSVDG